ncbi:hypothetical protein LSM04_002190, partial [Trypanosoma melophagium]|uniref:uncharacterized protein n=1 Tax=Trypanosoma melophagium TaxID=715481 RepID=UPI00351A9BAE
MAELPLLPQQQRTTTQYNPGAPKHRPVAFRPKRHFSHIPHTNAIITINTNTNMISASPYTHPEEEKNEQEKEKEQQEELSLIPVTNVFSRALYWLSYAEEQERGLIYRSYVASSPLLQCDTDAALSALIQDAFARREARLNAFVLHRQQIEADETMERWQNVEEPWERVCHKLRLVQELLEGKLLIWNMFLQQLNIWQQLLQLVVEEKRARLEVLGSFISCKPPLPCRCLLWDMEVLEESAIPLEPAVNLPCLFVSIVIGECDIIHDAL